MAMQRTQAHGSMAMQRMQAHGSMAMQRTQAHGSMQTIPFVSAPVVNTNPSLPHPLPGPVQLVGNSQPLLYQTGLPYVLHLVSVPVRSQNTPYNQVTTSLVDPQVSALPEVPFRDPVSTTSRRVNNCRNTSRSLVRDMESQNTSKRAERRNSASNPTPPPTSLGHYTHKRKGSHSEPAPKPLLSKKWFDMFQVLQEYKASHGDCLVPRLHPQYAKLANWVAEQRKQYKRWKNGAKCSMSQERFDLLSQIDFAWDAQETAWERRLQELKCYQKRFGHCRVSIRDPKFHRLGVWVKEQRYHYIQMKQGKPCPMTPTRVEQLNNLGFCWNVHEDIWMKHYQELKKCFGDNNVEKDPQLACWVAHQRRQYRRLRRGQISHMTSRRIELLNAIHFNWNVHDDDSSTSSFASCDSFDSTTLPK